MSVEKKQKKSDGIWPLPRLPRQICARARNRWRHLAGMDLVLDLWELIRGGCVRRGYLEGIIYTHASSEYLILVQMQLNQ